MAQEFINVGATPNDGTGDPLRVAFEKINNNFSNLFPVSSTTSLAYSVGNTAGQVIYEFPTDYFTQASFQIWSNDPITKASQDIVIEAQLCNANSNVKFVGHSTTFYGNAITRYDMDVSGGNVRLKVDPLVNATLTHFISSQVTYIGILTTMAIQADDYIDTDLSTENLISMATEQK